MNPQIIKGRWHIVDTNDGTMAIPFDLYAKKCTMKNVLDKLGDYLTGNEVYSYECKEGYGARLSMPGYMDCTEWTVFDSAIDARNYLIETYADGMEDDEDFMKMENAIGECYLTCEEDTKKHKHIFITIHEKYVVFDLSCNCKSLLFGSEPKLNRTYKELVRELVEKYEAVTCEIRDDDNRLKTESESE